MDSMEQVDHSPSPVGRRQLDLKKSFKLGIRSLLTTCSKEDFLNAFSTFNKAKQDVLYQIFIQVILSMHQNIEEEFESVCLESQVDTALNRVEQLMEEKNLDILSNEMTSLADAKQEVAKAKKDEITYLKSALEKVVEQNHQMKTQIDLLKKERLDSVGITNAVGELRSWNSNYLRQQ